MQPIIPSLVLVFSSVGCPRACSPQPPSHRRCHPRLTPPLRRPFYRSSFRSSWASFRSFWTYPRVESPHAGESSGFRTGCYNRGCPNNFVRTVCYSIPLRSKKALPHVGVLTPSAASSYSFHRPPADPQAPVVVSATSARPTARAIRNP